MVGYRRHPHLQFRPFGLVPTLQPAQHVGSAACGGGHVELLIVDARGHTVVHHHAVFVQHQAIAAFARLKFAPRIAVNAV